MDSSKWILWTPATPLSRRGQSVVLLRFLFFVTRRELLGSAPSLGETNKTTPVGPTQYNSLAVGLLVLCDKEPCHAVLFLRRARSARISIFPHSVDNPSTMPPTRSPIRIIQWQSSEHRGLHQHEILRLSTNSCVKPKERTMHITLHFGCASCCCCCRRQSILLIRAAKTFFLP